MANIFDFEHEQFRNTSLAALETWMSDELGNLTFTFELKPEGKDPVRFDKTLSQLHELKGIPDEIKHSIMVIDTDIDDS